MDEGGNTPTSRESHYVRVRRKLLRVRQILIRPV